jgi:hypothetical protein
LDCLRGNMLKSPLYIIFTLMLLTILQVIILVCNTARMLLLQFYCLRLDYFEHNRS